MYKKMMEDAKVKGYASEKMMWDAIDDVQDMLCIMNKEHPEKYWKFIRKQHGMLYSRHYSDEFAQWDLSQLRYTNKAGEKKEGSYWSIEQVEEATKRFVFPSGVNKYDKWVAFNVAYSDLCRKFDDTQILEMAYLFFFADEDWGENSSTKIWDYMCCKWGKG